MLKKISSFLLITFISTGVFSQELKDDLTRLQNGEDLNVLYRNESSFGIYAHTAGGIGLAYRRGQHVTGKRKRMLELEAQNFKHPKEVKSVNSIFENSKGFNYGKLNSFFLLRPGVGYQNVLYQKSDKKSVEIRYSYFVGVTLAFAKPVYLEIVRDPQDGVVSTEKYDPEEHSIDVIYGKASFFRGIDETKIIPGGYAKLALSFEYADRYNSIKAIETGVIFDIYPKVLPMMAYNRNQQAFALLYLKIIWGKKWF
ncbi:MAG: hypothetical protein K0S44_2879 [Bacteroidetes bacterium]|jgi:hypothetical protein|nr:hypothetical protein [Bacteroidota bacterium]